MARAEDGQSFDVPCGVETYRVTFGGAESNPLALEKLLGAVRFDPIARHACASIHAKVFGSESSPSFDASDAELEQIVADLRFAVERGLLGVTTLHAESFMEEARREDPVVGEAVPLSELAKSWIEIEVIDENDDVIPQQSVTVRLSDGSTRTGKTDEQGLLAYDGIPPGDCSVSFPSVEDGAWEKVS